MSQAAADPSPIAALAPAPIPLREIAPWALFAGVVLVALLYLVGMDQGATSVFGNSTVVHEFVHDARHLLGFPCH